MNRCGKAVVLCLLVPVTASCRSGFDSVQAVLDRHQHALEKLPAEQREQRQPYGEPVLTEKAEQLLPDETLSLEDARSIAIRANPDMHAAYARLEAARATITEARSAYFPKVTFTHTSTRTFHTPVSRNRLNTAFQPSQPIPVDSDTGSIAVTSLINALRLPIFAGGPEPNTSSFSEHSSAFTATWIVFDGFLREARLLASKAAYQASEASFSNVERLLIRSIDQAYYQVQLAEEQLRIARADEEFSQEQLDETQNLRNAGRATEADVGNFRVRVLAAKADVTAAKGLRETGRVVLAELMGLSEVTLPPTLKLSSLREESASEMDVPQPGPWIDRALASRPDLTELEQLVEQAQEERRIAAAAYLPTLTVSGSWGFDRVSSLAYENDDQSSAAAMELRWDIFTGGARRARLYIADAQLAELERRVKRLSLQVQREVRESIINLNDAQEQIRLRRESVETARESRRSIQVAYVAGKETLNRLNEAQRDFIAAEANLALARIQLRQAWSDLQMAVGAHRSLPGQTGQDDDKPVTSEKMSPSSSSE